MCVPELVTTHTCVFVVIPRDHIILFIVLGSPCGYLPFSLPFRVLRYVCGLISLVYSLDLHLTHGV